MVSTLQQSVTDEVVSGCLRRLVGYRGQGVHDDQGAVVRTQSEHVLIDRGSDERGRRELSTERKSGDDHAFGRHETVYATPDPHSAAFYAVVNRQHAESINSFSIGLNAEDRTLTVTRPDQG